MERVAYFIDGSNFYKTIKKKYSAPRDLGGLLNDIISRTLSGRKLIRPYYVSSQPEHPDPLQMKFYDRLRFMGYAVTILPLKKMYIVPSPPMCDKCKTPYKIMPCEKCELPCKFEPIRKYYEKGADMALAMEMLSLVYKKAIDTAILISGDGDFTKLLEFVKREGVRMELIHFYVNTSGDLKKQADKRWLLDTVLHDKIKLRPKDKEKIKGPEPKSRASISSGT